MSESMKLPLHQEADRIKDDMGNHICYLQRPVGHTARAGMLISCERAEYIVRACNAYLKITRLLKAAKCPCCDGSGGFYDNHGNACQCQWCDETKAAIAKAGE